MSAKCLHRDLFTEDLTFHQLEGQYVGHRVVPHGFFLIDPCHCGWGRIWPKWKLHRRKGSMWTFYAREYGKRDMRSQQ